MCKKAFLILLGCFVFSFSFGQYQQKYVDTIRQAWKLYQDKAYLESANTYSNAFAAEGNKGDVTDRYNAACSWALASKPDSAFAQLQKIAKPGKYSNYEHLTTDSDLSSLHKDKRWKRVVAGVMANKEEEEKKYYKPLVANLKHIFEEDQKYRLQIDSIGAKYGEMKAHWKVISNKDSLNLIEVKKILDSRGWLGADIVGRQGNQTLFLVIQHANLQTQLTYLPMLREAVKKEKASASSLALLGDRVALRQGKRQMYGSQVGHHASTGEYYVMPLEDPENVDNRRATVGLGPLQEYISNWGMTWDAEAYKKKLPEIETNQTTW